MKELSNFVHEKLYCSVGDLSLCGIFDAGFFFTNKLTYEPHMHLQHEIHIVLCGKYIIENLDGTELITLEPGMMALIPPKYYHNIIFDGNVGTDKFTFRLDFEQEKEKEYDRYYKYISDYFKEHENDIKVFAFEEAVSYMKKISEFMYRDDVGDKAMAEAYFKLFMTELVVEIIKTEEIRYTDKINVADTDSIARRKDIINHIISAKYSNPQFNIKDLADRLNLSVRQTNRVVVNLYGVTFHQLLTQARLNRAAKLLKRTQMNMKSISEMVGYDSSTGFFLAFKKTFGVTPGEYRASNIG